MDDWFGPNAFSILSAIALIRLVGWLTPGPNMLVVMNASINGGQRVGILTGWGVAFGGFLWAVLAVGGAAVLFTAFPQIALGFRLAGAGYLIWLGIKSLKSSIFDLPVASIERPKPGTGWKSFRNGFLVSATNPKAALFYGSILTTFVPVDAPPGLLIAIALMSGLIGVVTYTLTGTIFATRPVVRLFEAAQRPIKAVIGVLFCGLGISVAWDSILSVLKPLEVRFVPHGSHLV